jgi:hypothetical protein
LLDLNLLLVPYLNTVARARDEALLLELKLPEASAARPSDATPGLLLCFVALQFFFAMPITLSDHPPSTFRNWCFFTSGLVALACPGGGGAFCKLSSSRINSREKYDSNEDFHCSQVANCRETLSYVLRPRRSSSFYQAPE